MPLLSTSSQGASLCWVSQAGAARCVGASLLPGEAEAALASLGRSRDAGIRAVAEYGSASAAGSPSVSFPACPWSSSGAEAQPRNQTHTRPWSFPPLAWHTSSSFSTPKPPQQIHVSDVTVKKF